MDEKKLNEAHILLSHEAIREPIAPEATGLPPNCLRVLLTEETARIGFGDCVAFGEHLYRLQDINISLVPAGEADYLEFVKA
jgi:hypothetical protein